MALILEPVRYWRPAQEQPAAVGAHEGLQPAEAVMLRGPKKRASQMPRRSVNLLSTPQTYAARRNNANGSDQIVQIILIQDKLKQFNQRPDTIDIGPEEHHPLMRPGGRCRMALGKSSSTLIGIINYLITLIQQTDLNVIKTMVKQPLAASPRQRKPMQPEYPPSLVGDSSQ